MFVRILIIAFTALTLSGCAGDWFDSADRKPVIIAADTEIHDANALRAEKFTAKTVDDLKKKPKVRKKRKVKKKDIAKKTKTKKMSRHAAMKSGGFRPCPKGVLNKLDNLSVIYGYYVKNGACADKNNTFPAKFADNWKKQSIRLINGDPGFAAFVLKSVRDSVDVKGKNRLARVIKEEGCGLVKQTYCKAMAKAAGS